MAKKKSQQRRSLAFSHRKLSREWHPTKNGELTPKDVTYGSPKKVWWQCDNGHEWQTQIADRSRGGSGCPYCAGQRATPKTSLQGQHPRIAKQWHPTKNGEITPNKVLPRSGKKIWWQCSKGHEWQAVIYARTDGSGCPFCAGKRATPATSLAALYPEVARQWHPTKNRALTPKQMRPRSGKKVWWQCDNGHEWESNISNRVRLGRGCPYCAGSIATPETSLWHLYPTIAGQWHSSKNGDLTPQQVRPSSHKKVWWKCDKGHEWNASVGNRCRLGRGCPYCAGRRALPETSLRALYPRIARQWHPAKNGKLTPRDVTSRSSRKVWWKCDKGHEWNGEIVHRTAGAHGCPYCSGQRTSPEMSLKALHPTIARQWHPTKNGELTPQQVRPGSARDVWWRCSKGHQWRVSITQRVRAKAGCPYCSGRRITAQTSLDALHPTIATQWHPTKNGELTPRKVHPGSMKKVWWKCDKGHEWMTLISLRTRDGTGCPYCSGQRTSPEMSLMALYPTIARQWHPAKNGELRAQHVVPGSGRKVWWRCDRGQDHQWQQTVRSRTQGNGTCPYCAGRRVSVTNSLAGIFPAIAEQWHPKKNGKTQPSDVLASSKQRVWWRCPVGHVYAMAVGDRTIKGRNCPACAVL